jgi:hypothetical protein
VCETAIVLKLLVVSSCNSGKGNGNHEIGTGFSVHKRSISVVSVRMSFDNKTKHLQIKVYSVGTASAYFVDKLRHVIRFTLQRFCLKANVHNTCWIRGQIKMVNRIISNVPARKKPSHLVCSLCSHITLVNKINFTAHGW